MSQSNNQNQIKIVLLGETNVGKTTIFQRFCDNKVDKSCISTIGVEFKIKTYKYKGKVYSLQIFDTAGQERFRSVGEAYFRIGDGFFIIFDLTNIDSLKAVNEWIDKVNQTIENPKFIIVGNKDDIKEQIPKENINEVLSKYIDKGIQFIKTSAYKNSNINNAFEIMIDILQKDNNNNEIKEENIKIGKKKSDKDKCCF